MRIMTDFCGDIAEFTACFIEKIEPTFRFDVSGWEIFFVKNKKVEKVFCTSFEIIG